MKLNFSDKKYVEIAEEIIEKSKNGNKGEVHAPEEALMLLLKDVELENLDNLCQKLRQYYTECDIEECYDLTQGRGKIFENNSDIVKNVIYNCAYECLGEGKYLGNKILDNTTINTSGWISHCLYEAKLSGELASFAGLDSKRARTLALLHDFGRKYKHDLSHVSVGFEKLVDLGWINEASITLTHSFINGGRCAYCDPAEEGFYLKDGKPCWESEENKDDVARFIEKYQYDTYDDIINIADLMAKDSGIVEPYERVVKDIATRKKPDPKNRSYFLSELTNKLNELMARFKNDEEYDIVTPLESENVMESNFKMVSERFYSTYVKMLESYRETH